MFSCFLLKSFLTYFPLNQKMSSPYHWTISVLFVSVSFSFTLTHIYIHTYYTYTEVYESLTFCPMYKWSDVSHMAHYTRKQKAVLTSTFRYIIPMGTPLQYKSGVIVGTVNCIYGNSPAQTTKYGNLEFEGTINIIKAKLLI